MFWKKETKTNWKPLYVYKPFGSKSRKMLFIRYNKTGLFDFKTKRICRDMYECEPFTLKIDTQKVFESFWEQINDNS